MNPCRIAKKARTHYLDEERTCLEHRVTWHLPWSGRAKTEEEQQKFPGEPTLCPLGLAESLNDQLVKATARSPLLFARARESFLRQAFAASTELLLEQFGSLLIQLHEEMRVRREIPAGLTGAIGAARIEFFGALHRYERRLAEAFEAVTNGERTNRP